MKDMENTKTKIKREIGTVGVGTGLNAEERLSLVHLLWFLHQRLLWPVRQF